MELRLKRADFLAELLPMQGIVERRTTIPVLSHLLLQAKDDRLHLAGTDLDVSLTSYGADDPVLGTLPPSATVFQWHHYTFDVPPSGVELARSAVCTQAFRLTGQPAWGIQFHAEVTLPMVTTWTEEDPDELPMPASELRARSAEVMEASNAQGRALAEAFLREAAASR